MRNILEYLLRATGTPDPERAERLWAEYRAGGAGADAAFATLLAWYGGAIYRRVWGFVRSGAADDVFQDVLVKLHRERAKLATFGHALRWLRTVANAQCVDARRRARRRAARERARAVSPEATAPPALLPDLQEGLRAELAKLSAEEREAVALVFFEGLTRKDAAAAAGVHRDTLAKLLDGALAKLRASLSAVVAAGAAGTAATVEAALGERPPVAPARLAELVSRAWVAPATGWLSPTKVKLFALILVGGLATAASAYYLSRSPDVPKQSPPLRARLGVEPLEDRSVPASFTAAASVGGTSADHANDIATDAAGNTYIVGSVVGTVDFDPARAHPGDVDVVAPQPGMVGETYVAKYAPDGSLLWARGLGRRNEVMLAVSGVAADASGGVYLGGHYRDGAAFGNVVLGTAGGEIDGFVARLDAAGGVVWAKGVGGALNDMSKSLAVDAAGNAFLATYAITGSAPPGTPGGTTGSVNARVTKFSPDGAEVWARDVGTAAQFVFAEGLTTDAGGNVYVAGRFRGTADFFPSAAVAGDTAAGTTADSGYVLKLTAAGGFAWVSPFVGITPKDSATPGGSICNDVAVDAGGNVIVGGYYRGRVDFKPGGGTTELPNSVNRDTGFVVKLTSAGALSWAAPFGVTVKRLGFDAAGNVYAGGEFAGTGDFNPGAGVYNLTATSRFKDIFVVSLTSGGAFRWAAALNGTGFAQLNGLAVAGDGTVSLAGIYQESIDFDPDPTATNTLTSAGGSDIFHVKLRRN